MAGLRRLCPARAITQSERLQDSLTDFSEHISFLRTEVNDGNISSAECGVQKFIAALPY